MFVDEIKIYSCAGHGGKGCVAFQREKYRTKVGPSGGNGGRGGDVILEADHDLNNLIGQYYQPRLIAEDGKSGMGKGMDGHAGKDLLVKVPCGTLVWKGPDQDQPSAPTASGDPEKRQELRSSSSGRPLLRTLSAGRALEIDLSREAPEAAPSPSEEIEGTSVADLTEHGQRFVLCKGGRGGLG